MVQQRLPVSCGVSYALSIVAIQGRQLKSELSDALGFRSSADFLLSSMVDEIVRLLVKPVICAVEPSKHKAAAE